MPPSQVAAIPRRFFLLGATGRTGLPFLSAALARGHAVTAFVRSTAKLPATEAANPRLRAFTGELHEAAKIAAAMKEAQPDVVLAMLASDPAPHTAISTGTHNALLALAGTAQPGSSRRAMPFISIAAWGVGPTEAYVTGMFGRLVLAVGKSILWSKPFADITKQLAELEEAKLNGLVRPTLILPPILTNGACTETYLSGEASAMRDAMGVTNFVSRASMADLCLKLAEKAAAGEVLPQWVALTNP